MVLNAVEEFITENHEADSATCAAACATANRRTTKSQIQLMLPVATTVVLMGRVVVERTCVRSDTSVLPSITDRPMYMSRIIIPWKLINSFAIVV